MNKFLAISLAVLLVLAVSITGCGGTPEVPPILTIGAVYGGAINDFGYNQALHKSILKIKDNIPGVKIIEAESVATGALAKGAMQLMINQNATLIFSTAFDFYAATKELADANPTVAFEWCGGGQNATANLGTFFGKPPDGWYLMGMAAALMTQNLTNPTFGFVGAFSFLGWTRTFINAFTLGAQSVYPPIVRNETTNITSPSPVTVKVMFTNSWADLAKQVLTTNTLVNYGASVITMHVDAPQSVIQTAETRGVYSIGYQSVDNYIFAYEVPFAPNKWICGTGFTFGELLTGVAQTVINGTHNGTVKLWGWNTTAMVLAPWGHSVNQTVKDAIALAQAELGNGTRKTFGGPIYSTNGTIYALPSISPYPLLVTQNVTIPEGALGWADTSYVWGVNVTN